MNRLLYLIFVLFLMGACSHGDLVAGKNKTSSQMQGMERDRLPEKPCSRSKAEALVLRVRENPSYALEAAACYAFLAGHGKNRAQNLADAQEGRRMAEAAVKASPDNAMAHYLAAYLTGLEAENDPVRGLELVPFIEREALTAAHLNPTIGNGGPDRMLGELYLKAPSFPISVGDVEKAIAHFRKAVEAAPNFLQNRIGLAEALTENEEPAEACLEIEKIFAGLPPKEEMMQEWKRSLNLLRKMCGMCNNK